MRLNFVLNIFYAFSCLALIDRIKADDESPSVQQQEATPTTTSDPTMINDDEDMDLESMTNEELEDICTSRGFEVVKEKDKETGDTKIYTHDDYVNAAKQCLEIEAEMDEILGDNPELVKEIEAEAERMRLENERLEQEIASMIDEHSSQEDGSGGSNGANHASSFSSEGEGTIVDIVDDESDEVIDLDRDAALSDSIEQGLPTNSNDGSDGMHSTEQPVPASAEDLPDLSFGAVTREVKAKIMQDFHMLADLFVPKSARGPLKEALKPVVNVVRDTTKTIMDMVNRYTGQFFDKANSAEGAKQETAVAMK